MIERKDVDASLQWKRSDVFENDEAWDAEYKAVETEYSNYDFSVFKGKLNDKQTLLNCLTLCDTIERRLEKLYLYANKMTNIMQVA